MARNNADLAHEIEELIKKYNKKPEKKRYYRTFPAM